MRDILLVLGLILLLVYGFRLMGRLDEYLDPSRTKSHSRRGRSARREGTLFGGAAPVRTSKGRAGRSTRGPRPPRRPR